MAVPTTASLRRTRRKLPVKSITFTRWRQSYRVVLVTVCVGLSCSMMGARWNSAAPVEQQPVSRQQQQQQQLPATLPQCSFREYPPRRYYGFNNIIQPEFLTGDTPYIYGLEPIMLPTLASTNNHPNKLCILNQSEWQPLSEPNFADGTNPSIILLDRLKQHVLYSPLQQLGVKYIATVCLTNSACSWNDSPEEQSQYQISNRVKPWTVRTMLLLLDQHGHTIQETTLYLYMDAGSSSTTKWGHQSIGDTLLHVRALDDARLFVHEDELWVSFREGKIFGYDRQVIMKVHLELLDKNRTTLTATLYASETSTFCCGRNMAMMQSVTGALQSLSWADPVTVIDVDNKKLARRRRLLQEHKNSTQTSHHRQLKATTQLLSESHFHGTNAFMVPFGNNELLGMGHIHRPPGRAKNDYARFGHHYTHAFFTITATPPHQLKRLSGELVFPSASNNNKQQDADIIQFASGLEVDGSTVIVAYGINDCEGAMIHIDRTVVNGLLKDVSEGKEVVDLMEKLRVT